MVTRKTTKIKINPQRLRDAMKLQTPRWSAKSLAENDGVGVNEKTIRRCLDEGLISPKLLEKVSKALNVDPSYLQGKFDPFYDQLTDKDMRKLYKDHFLSPVHHPYAHHLPEEVNYDNLFFDILKLYGIPAEQYRTLPRAQQSHLREDIHRALYRVLCHYFRDCSPFGYYSAMGMPEPTLVDIEEILIELMEHDSGEAAE
ncbi:helix-turn-helix transcriptional regulator [Bifidobacterium oedipodis]|uniref:HTH cro/C1-type domain-containing protein n=1 Tax=Bifidobacterium oedipodis TaxID=2675322 RepID=A0A7Y0HTK8_9BIFI|nr:helix-turn-helix transcriptional regulator [Bifidobacterium sp. DSM 109957]NMM95206.1 hypothetical protein [Bifidobacterium sp. DSM 109957]